MEFLALTVFVALTVLVRITVYLTETLLIAIKKIGPNAELVNRRNKNEEPQMDERIINSDISLKLTFCITFKNFWEYLPFS